MKGNMSQIAHAKRKVCTPAGQEAADVSSNDNSVVRKRHEGELQGGKRTTTAQLASHLYCRFVFFAKYELTYVGM